MDNRKANHTMRWKVNYNIVKSKYYVVTEYSGLPAADYISSKSGLIMPQNKDSSADVKD